jgi:hypothetical protein
MRKNSPRCLLWVLPWLKSSGAPDKHPNLVAHVARMRRPSISTCASNAYGLIALLRELRVPVIVISSSIEVPLPISLNSPVMLEGLFTELQLFGCLRTAKEVLRWGSKRQWIWPALCPAIEEQPPIYGHPITLGVRTPDQGSGS